jgi:diguanylate cyclase (GGDEF)-like protein
MYGRRLLIYAGVIKVGALLKKITGLIVPAPMPEGYMDEFEETRLSMTRHRLKIGGGLLLLYCLIDIFMPDAPSGLPIPPPLVPSLLFAVTAVHLVLLFYKNGTAPFARPVCYSFAACLCAVECVAMYNAFALRPYPSNFFISAALLAVIPGFRPRVAMPMISVLYVFNVCISVLLGHGGFERYMFITHSTLMLAVAAIAADALYRHDRRLFIDAQNMRRLNKDLEDRATHDELTKLHNRHAFEAHFPAAINQARREKKTIVVMMLDVDCFKMYNDDFGHLAGDKALYMVADCMRASFQRGSDFSARYGGEEFVIVARMEGRDAEGAANTLVHRVESMRLANPRSTAGPNLTVSVGLVYLVPGSDDTREKILEAADEALYSAKEAGRNRVVSRFIGAGAD